ncbi:proteasome subunit beta [Candidatus Woesearchaeota archaeon]|nr:proteasome subunit beta [Candidatus Woesearchaeota archaeon]
METKDIVKKGTTTVGIVCSDGIILAADKRATAGNYIVTKQVKKIYQIADNASVTMAGTVSDAQLMVKLIKAETALKKMRTGRQPLIKEVANLLGTLVYSNIRKMSMIPGISHFVMGGFDETGYHLYDIFADGSVTLCDDFISSGSGSVMAYGVLETLYKKGISVEEGAKLAVKCINAALQRDSASGGGMDVVAITKGGIKTVLDKELNQKIEF